MMADKSLPGGYIVGIDGLRALAVLSVMFFHLDAGILPGGFTGVDIFFVISGYVVTASLFRHSGKGFTNFISGFYARRIRRILPALLVCLVLTTLLSVLFIPEAWLSDSSYKTGQLAFFGLGNYGLLWFNDGYFSPRAEYNPFTHTWSLGVEEQFYLIFPLLLFFVLKFNQRNNLVGFFANSLLPILLLVSFFIAGMQSTSSPDYAFYLLPARFWELACGAVLLLLHSRQRCLPSSEMLQTMVLLAGCLLIVVGFFWADKQGFPFPWAILPVAGTLLLISGLSANYGPARFRLLFENRVSVYLGQISYSLYLWHWPVYVLLRWTLGLESAWHMLLALILTFILGVASFHLIEQPARNARLSPGRRSPTIFAGILVTIVAFSGSFALAKYQEQFSLSVTRDKQAWYPDDYKESGEQRADNKSETSDRPTLFVIGDSHAGAYGVMLGVLAERHNIKVVNSFSGGCGVAGLIRPSDSAFCKSVLTNRVAELKSQAKAGDVVFLASLRMHRFSDQWTEFPVADVDYFHEGPDAVPNRQLAFEEARELLEQLESIGVQVIIDAPKPVFKAPPFRCADWFNSTNPVCKPGLTMERSMLLKYMEPIEQSLLKLDNLFSNLHVWEPFPVLCPGDPCSAFHQGQPLFFDGDHLSGYGNRLLYPSFERLLMRILKGDSPG